MDIFKYIKYIKGIIFAFLIGMGIGAFLAGIVKLIIMIQS